MDIEILELSELLNNEEFTEFFGSNITGEKSTNLFPLESSEIENFSGLNSIFMKRAKSLYQSPLDTCVTFATSLSLSDAYYNTINPNSKSTSDSTYEYSETASPYGTVSYYNRNDCTDYTNGVSRRDINAYNDIVSGVPFISIKEGKKDDLQRYRDAIIPKDTRLLKGKIGVIGNGSLLKGSKGYILDENDSTTKNISYLDYVKELNFKLNSIKYCLSNNIGVTCSYICPNDNLTPGQIIDYEFEYQIGGHANSIIGIDGDYMLTRNSWGIDDKPLKFIWYKNWGNIFSDIKYVKYENIFQVDKDIDYARCVISERKNPLQLFFEKIKALIAKILLVLFKIELV